MEISGIKRFSDFSDEPPGLDGEKISIDRILNREFLATGYRILSSKFPGKNKSGNALQLQIKLVIPGVDLENTPPNIVFSGSDILIDQINKYADHLPFLAKIVKINRYYTFQ